MKDAGDRDAWCLAGGQKMVAATFRHEVVAQSRSLSCTRMRWSPTWFWARTGERPGPASGAPWPMRSLYRRQKLIGMVYRSELAQELKALGYRDREDPCRRALRDRGRTRGV